MGRAAGCFCASPLFIIYWTLIKTTQHSGSRRVSASFKDDSQPYECEHCLHGSELLVSYLFTVITLGDIYDQVFVFCGHNAVPPSSWTKSFCKALKNLNSVVQNGFSGFWKNLFKLKKNKFIKMEVLYRTAINSKKVFLVIWWNCIYVYSDYANAWS